MSPGLVILLGLSRITSSFPVGNETSVIHDVQGQSADHLCWDQETQGAQKGASPSFSSSDYGSRNYGVAYILLSVLEYSQREPLKLSSNHEVRTINVKKSELIYYR